MRLVSWNILAGGGSRCGAIVTRLERCDADIIVLQETMTTRASDLCHALGRAGYAHRFSAPRGPRERGLCVLSRLPLRDHAFASPRLADRVTSCRYDHEVRTRGWSDHSLLIVELAPKSPAVRSLAFSTGKR